MHDSKKKSTLYSIRISAASTVISGLFQLVTLSFLSRLLNPSDYGEYAICWSLASLFPVLVNNIIERSDVIGQNDISPSERAMTDLVISVIASFLLILSVNLIDALHKTSVNNVLLIVVCSAVSIQSLSISKRIALRRSIDFGPIVKSELLGLVVGQGIIAIIAASLGLGALSLGLGLLGQNIIIASLLWKGKSPRLGFPDLKLISNTFFRSLSMSGNVTLEIFNGQVTPLLLGFRLGDASLGLFNRIYSIVQIPLQLMINSSNRVVVSALFSISQERERFVNACQKMVTITTILTAPVAAGMAGSSRNFVLSIFGINWTDGIEILPWISLSGITMMTAALFGTICEARNMLKTKSVVQALSTGILIFCTLIGTRYGLKFAVIGISLSNCLFLLAYMTAVSKGLGLPFISLLRWILPGIAYALPCFGIALICGHVVHIGPHAGLIVQILACAVTLPLLLVIFSPTTALEVFDAFLPRSINALGMLRRFLVTRSER